MTAVTTLPASGWASESSSLTGSEGMDKASDEDGGTGRIDDDAMNESV